MEIVAAIHHREEHVEEFSRAEVRAVARSFLDK